MTTAEATPNWARKIKTNQDALDKVWNHFIENRHGPGYSKENGCVTYDETRPHARCALGIMCPLPVLREKLQTTNDKKGLKRTVIGDTGFISNAICNNPDSTVDHFFLNALQSAHDSAAEYASLPKGHYEYQPFTQTMRTRLTSLANKNNLTVPGGTR